MQTILYVFSSILSFFYANFIKILYEIFEYFLSKIYVNINNKNIKILLILLDFYDKHY